MGKQPDSDPADPATRAESALKMIGAIPDAMFRVNSAGIILDYCPSSMRLLGEPETLIGHSVSAIPAASGGIVSDALVDLCLRRAQLAIEHEKPQSAEIQLENSAWPLWFEVRAFRSDPEGDEAVIIFREISEERRQRIYRQDQLQGTRALVSRMVHERADEYARLAARISGLLDQSDDSIRDALRALVVELKEGAQIEPGMLSGEIETLIAEVCGQSVAASVRMELAPEHFGPTVATGVFTIVRECLVCICSHSQADRLRISLVNTAETLSLMISDYGAEDSRQESDERAICMAKMHHQAEQLGASLRITPGRRGTAVRMRLELVGIHLR